MGGTRSILEAVGVGVGAIFGSHTSTLTIIIVCHSIATQTKPADISCFAALETQNRPLLAAACTKVMNIGSVMEKGSCLCGDVKYEVEIFPDKIFNCHCQFCRKAHGSAYATMALANGSTLKIIDPTNKLSEHKNALGGFRAFCSSCGSRLMNYGPDKNLYLSIALATIDTEINYEPVAHCNTESKASWCTPYEGITSFSGFPPMGKSNA